MPVLFKRPSLRRIPRERVLARRAPLRRALLPACGVLLALALSACAKTVSTSSYSGESKGVAETIKNLQADVTAGEQKKICENDLASTLVAKLGSTKSGCEQAIKNQLAEVDSFDVTITSITLGGTSAARTASAHVKSVYAGKKERPSTLSLVKEGGKWKISALSEQPSTPAL
jgi:hypothetical protein